MKQKKNQQGFTIIELLVVIGIMSVILAIIIPSIPQAKSQFALSRAAYAFAQNVSRAQDMTLGSMQYQDASGTVQAVKGYGVYIDASNNKQYKLYADKSPGNQIYDSQDYIVQTIDLSVDEPGVIIESIQNVSGQNTSINFAPPNPDTNIDGLLAGQSEVDVVFALEADPTNTRTVSINISGLIEVK